MNHHGQVLAEDRSVAMNHDAQFFAGDGSHLSCTNDADVVAFAFYNVGIINNTILGSNWYKPKNGNGPQQHLKADIAHIFQGNASMQCLFLSEFGQMSPSIDLVLRETIDGVSQPSTQEYFEKLVRDINVPNLTVHAMAPYVAFIDSTVWKVNKCVCH